MKFTAALALPALLLVGGPALAQPDAYRASGVQPRWELRIDDGRIVYRDTRSRVVVPAPRPQIGFAGETYFARGLTVNVVHARCSLGRASYHDRVMVTVRGRTQQGCGGATSDERVSAARLDGTSWAIALINGAPARTARAAQIRFADGRISGNAGCNSFGGGYTVNGGRLTANQIISTRMACVGPGVQVEATLFRILRGPAAVTWRDGNLTLSAGSDSVTLTPSEAGGK